MTLANFLVEIVRVCWLCYNTSFFSSLSPFCSSWVIYAVFNARIEVTFDDFDLEWSKTCKPYDYVRVTDKCNGSVTWSANLGIEEDGYCGNRAKFHVTSRCNNIRIEFKSDDSLTGKGFNATYKIIQDVSKYLSTHIYICFIK